MVMTISSRRRPRWKRETTPASANMRQAVCDRWASTQAADRQRQAAEKSVLAGARCERWVSARTASRTTAALVAARWLLQTAYRRWRATTSEECERWASAQAGNRQWRAAHQSVLAAARCERWVSAQRATTTTAARWLMQTAYRQWRAAAGRWRQGGYRQLRWASRQSLMTPPAAWAVLAWNGQYRTPPPTVAVAPMQRCGSSTRALCQP